MQYPSREIEKICDFLGLVFRDNILKLDGVEIAEDLKKINHYNNVLKPITTSYLGKGRKELSSKEKRKLSVLMNDSLKKWDILRSKVKKFIWDFYQRVLSETRYDYRKEHSLFCFFDWFIIKCGCFIKKYVKG